eukprot:2045688-Prymnesium_polylepis.1
MPERRTARVARPRCVRQPLSRSAIDTMQTLELWESFQRRKRRQGDVSTATSSSSARGSAGR